MVLRIKYFRVLRAIHSLELAVGLAHRHRISPARKPREKMLLPDDVPEEVSINDRGEPAVSYK